MGLYRLVLAFLVAMSHAGIGFYGFNIGVVAVISFFLLSGLVMTALIEKNYKHRDLISMFYLDRATRLLPQFVFYMLLATAFIYFFKIESPFLTDLTVAKWLLNLSIIPLAFFMYWADGALIIPQAWSLGLEATFYLTIPFIIIYLSPRWIYLLAGVSFAIFLTAYFGYINADNFGYRLLPGTLFMFLAGSSFFKSEKYVEMFRASVLIASVVLLTTAFLNTKIYERPFNKEVLVGLLVGMAAIKFLKRVNFSKTDEFFGNISYGVFLNHFIVIWAMQKFFTVSVFDAKAATMLLLSSSVLAVISFFLVERPALIWRRALRTRAKRRQQVRAVTAFQ